MAANLRGFLCINALVKPKVQRIFSGLHFTLKPWGTTNCEGGHEQQQDNQAAQLQTQAPHFKPAVTSEQATNGQNLQDHCETQSVVVGNPVN